ncbi:MAG: hypothetical protein JW849_05020, partial [Phycisphaerae bacterium]|nr:hypothetical protein [Phycisphaerae bacterium]
ASHADPLVYCAKRPHSSKFNPLWDDCEKFPLPVPLPSGLDLRDSTVFFCRLLLQAILLC